VPKRVQLESLKLDVLAFGLLRIPMMSISHSDLMPISAERSDAGLSQCETVIDIRQEFCWFSLSWCMKSSFLSASHGFGR